MGGILRTVGQVAVGALGYAVGGPIGFAVANLIYGGLFPAESGQVRRFGDTNLEGSRIGAFIPEFYGQMGKVHGNVIDCGYDKDGKPAGIMIRTEKKKVGGKGGGGQTIEEEVGYLTAAYLIGAGPLYIDKIVTDTSDGETVVFDRFATSGDKGLLENIAPGLTKNPITSIFPWVVNKPFNESVLTMPLEAVVNKFYNKKRGGDYTQEYAPDGSLVAEYGPKLNMYFGTEYQEPDPILQQFHGAMLPAYRGVTYVVFNQFKIENNNPNFQFWVRSPIDNRVEIIRTRLLRTGIPESRMDIKSVWGSVAGAWVTAREPARTLCESIASQCFTDFVFTGTAVKDSSKYSARETTLAKSEMGAHTGDQHVDAIEITMKGDAEFTSDLSVPFLDIDLNYDDNEAHAVRYIKDQVVARSVDMPVAGRLDEMMAWVKTMQDVEWTADRTFSAQLMPGTIDISPGEVVNIPDIKFPVSAAPTQTDSYYITGQEISPENIITLQGEKFDRNILFPTDTSHIYPDELQIKRPTLTVPIVMPPLDAVVDAPVVDELANLTGLAYAACAAIDENGNEFHWQQAQFTPEQEFVPTVVTQDEATMGVCKSYTYLQQNVSLIDYNKSLDIMMYNGTLASATEEDVLTKRANTLALCTDDPAQTLIVQFVTATKTGDKTYTISGILPARCGTDYVTSIPSGSRAILAIDHTGAQLKGFVYAPIDNFYIGSQVSWRGFSDEENDTNLRTFTFTANSRRPLSPYYIRKTARTAGTSITIAWCARTRFQQGASWAMTNPSDPDNYRIRFKSGATVKHTLTVTGAKEVTLTEADIASWYGSLPVNLTGDIAQISDTVGAGHTKDFSIPL